MQSWKEGTVWLLLYDREQRRCWRLGELFGLGSIFFNFLSSDPAWASERALLDIYERTHAQYLGTSLSSTGPREGRLRRWWGWEHCLPRSPKASGPCWDPCPVKLPKPRASPQCLPPPMLRH